MAEVGTRGLTFHSTKKQNTREFKHAASMSPYLPVWEVSVWGYAPQQPDGGHVTHNTET